MDRCVAGLWMLLALSGTVLAQQDEIQLSCGNETFKVLIPVSLVNADNVDLIHLDDKTCKAKLVPGQTDYLYIESTYNNCGTTAEEDAVKKAVTYKNRVEAKLSRDGLTTQQRPINIELKCDFDQSNIVSTSVINASGNANNAASSALSALGNYYTMRIYREDTFAVAETPPINVYGEDPVFVKLQLEAEKDATLDASDCHATPTYDPHDPVYRDLIRQGCAADSGVTVLDISSQDRRPTLDFSVSRIKLDESDQVYIHCYAATYEGDPSVDKCPPTSRRRRRSNTYHLLTEGPVIWHPEPTTDHSLDDGVVMALLLVSGVISTVSLAIIIYVTCRCLRRKPTQTKVDLYG